MSPAVGSVLLNLIGAMSAVTVSAGFFSGAALALAYLAGRADEKAGEWARYGAAAGFLFGLGTAPFVFMALAS